MKDKRCPVFVDGKACGLPLTRSDQGLELYTLATYECGLGHRLYYLPEPKQSCDEIKKRMFELVHKYAETYDPAIIKELYQFACVLEKMEKVNKQ
jgi:hypothetical protein